ncbi:YdeI/OmpD-associated family protein [Ancylomarina euxinus]|nr:YdeI/OmpD-associated family protein [Ancylomarina euxinus]MCZ4695350.1 YdeI/OmpD-associated family protein [Ancylomarina euxinus]MUP15546.1 DUF1905 domain-containing protein [Ancylomarina euxinus]
MKKAKTYRFKAEIYKTGINYCVDVPAQVTSKMTATKGYIKIKGRVNQFLFKKSLVPIKNGLFRLFVNMPTLKGANTALGKTADFEIEQDFEMIIKEYPVPEMLTEQLTKAKLIEDFNHLTPSRRKNILKYLSFIKTEKTLQKNIEKLISQLHNNEKNPQIP